MPIIPIIIIHLIACLLAFFAWRNYKTWKLINDMETRPAAEVTEGVVEVEGHVGTVGSKHLSPMTNRDGVYVHFKVQERRTRNMRYTETMLASAMPFKGSMGW